MVYDDSMDNKSFSKGNIFFWNVAITFCKMKIKQTNIFTYLYWEKICIITITLQYIQWRLK